MNSFVFYFILLSQVVDTHPNDCMLRFNFSSRIDNVSERSQNVYNENYYCYCYFDNSNIVIVMDVLLFIEVVYRSISRVVRKIFYIWFDVFSSPLSMGENHSSLGDFYGELFDEYLSVVSS